MIHTIQEKFIFSFIHFLYFFALCRAIKFWIQGGCRPITVIKYFKKMSVYFRYYHFPHYFEVDRGLITLDHEHHDFIWLCVGSSNKQYLCYSYGYKQRVMHFAILIIFPEAKNICSKRQYFLAVVPINHEVCKITARLWPDRCLHFCTVHLWYYITDIIAPKRPLAW